MGHYITFDGGSGTGKGEILAWLEEYLRWKGRTVCVARDNELDPLRDYGKSMIAWCEQHGLDHQTFLLPVFVAGGKIAEEKLAAILPRFDFVLRDRSFISSLAYQPATGIFTPDQVWDLYVHHMGFRIPDVAVIVDAEVEVAAARIALRKKQDKGLGGQMSGTVEKRRRIRQLFLDLPETLSGKLPVEVVSNNEPPTDDRKSLQKSIEQVSLQLVDSLTGKGIRF